MILTKLLLRSSHTFPYKTSFIDVDRNKNFTYLEMAIRAEKVKRVLIDQGLVKGERLAVLLNNQSTYAEIIFGATAMGAIVVPINNRLNENELLYILNDSGANILIIGEELFKRFPKLIEKARNLRKVFVVQDSDELSIQIEGVYNYENLLNSQKDETVTVNNDITENDIAFLLYTSGTTGRPKGVMHTHKSLFFNILSILYHLKPKEDDIHLHTAPLFHVGGITNLLNKTLIGATNVFLKSFDATRVLEVCDTEKITSVFLVPTMLNRVLNHPEFDRYDISNLRLLIYGAAPMPVQLLKLAKEKIPNLSFGQGYGSTETASAIIMLGPEQHKIEGSEKEQRRLQSCGQIGFGVEVKIIDENGREVPQGVQGQLIVRGPMVMKGYWNSPEETNKAIKNGWYYTGDIGYRDEDNFYYIVDRSKDMIVSGGENISSIEIEEILYKHPGISECAVIGVPDDLWGEAVKAVVVTKQGYSLTEEEVIRFVKEFLAGYKVPKSVDFIKELPKSSYGKILKHKLREQYWSNIEKNVN